MLFLPIFHNQNKIKRLIHLCTEMVVCSFQKSSQWQVMGTGTAVVAADGTQQHTKTQTCVFDFLLTKKVWAL